MPHHYTNIADSLSRTELRVLATGDMVTPIYLRDGKVKRWLLEDYLGEDTGDTPVYTRTEFCDQPADRITFPCYIRARKRILWKVKEAA